NDPVHNAPTKQALYDAIKAKVRFGDVVVIMAGVYSTYSEWISKEIRIAKSDFDKPILAVKPWANRRVSTVVANAADEIAAWNTSSIVSAIRRLDPCQRCWTSQRRSPGFRRTPMGSTTAP